jgi:hypothetical protein
MAKDQFTQGMELEPDLSDPLVFHLISQNHQPMESIVLNADLSIRDHRIVCEKDYEPWPCRLRLLLNDTDEPSSIRFTRRHE